MINRFHGKRLFSSESTQKTQNSLSQTEVTNQYAKTIFEGENEKLKENYVRMLKECKEFKIEESTKVDTSGLENALKKAEELIKHSFYS
jgi:hypothetical protein